MIKYIRQDDIDTEKWDKTIDRSINGLVYAKSWYLDIVAPHWDALVENDYECVFPLVKSKKWNINYLYQPVFTQQLGLFSSSLLTEEKMIRFLQEIPKHFKLIEINLNTHNKIASHFDYASSWINHELDMIHPYEKLYKNYSSNLKRNLKKSEKNGLSYVKNVKPDEIIKLFRENKGKKIRQLGERDYLTLTRLCYAGIYKGQIATYGVYSERNELCAGAIMLFSKKKAIFLFSGLNKEGRDSGGMMYLIDSFIRENQQKHLTLDFEGSNDPNLARFYKSFGSETTTYPHISINNLNSIQKILHSIYKRFKQIR